MGIQKDSSTTLSIFLAIFFHKPTENLALGSLMLKEEVSNFHYTLFTVILALITPLGIFIGLGMTSLDTPELVFGYFNAIATGSFLYISTTEILSDEFHALGRRSDKLKRFGSFLLGIFFVTLTEVFLQEDHGPSGENIF